MDLNVNTQVLIRELPRGTEAFKKHHSDLGLDPNDYYKMCIQPDGRLKMPLHNVMLIYGAACFMGPEPPFETTIEVLDA